MNGSYPLPSAMLPHSYPFVLIDRIVEYEAGKRIVCLKNVTINENYFKGHFSDDPIMPGVLIIEAMAQASGLITAGNEPVKAFLSRVNDARLKKTVVPGDCLIITSSLIHKLHPLYVFEAEAKVNDFSVASAEITLAVI
jgi:3-hydroxyacyl-[acyl-carrier-protein] dehydratase